MLGIIHRQSKQRTDADDNAENEIAQAAEEPRASFRLRDELGCVERAERTVAGERAFALDEPARHVTRDRLDDASNLVGFRQHRAAEAAVLHETVLPLVAAHLH